MGSDFKMNPYIALCRVVVECGWSQRNPCMVSQVGLHDVVEFCPGSTLARVPHTGEWH